MQTKKCTKCNKEKTLNEFYATWSHWCNDCINKRKQKIEHEEFMKNGGIDGKEGKIFLKSPESY